MQDYSIASSIGFYELARHPGHIVLAPVRAVYDFPEDTPDYVTIFCDRAEVIYRETGVTIEQALPLRSVADQMQIWVFDFAQERQAQGKTHKLKAWEPLQPFSLPTA